MLALGGTDIPLAFAIVAILAGKPQCGCVPLSCGASDNRPLRLVSRAASTVGMGAATTVCRLKGSMQVGDDSVGYDSIDES